MSVSNATRKILAIRAFEITSYYESLISNWFNRDNEDLCQIKSSFPLKKSLNYDMEKIHTNLVLFIVMVIINLNKLMERICLLIIFMI